MIIMIIYDYMFKESLVYGMIKLISLQLSELPAWASPRRAFSKSAFRSGSTGCSCGEPLKSERWNSSGGHQSCLKCL